MEFFRKINLQDYDGILEVNKFTRSFKTSTSELYQHILEIRKDMDVNEHERLSNIISSILLVENDENISTVMGQ
jgi:hypothetical protein